MYNKMYEYINYKYVMNEYNTIIFFQNIASLKLCSVPKNLNIVLCFYWLNICFLAENFYLKFMEKFIALNE